MSQKDQSLLQVKQLDFQQVVDKILVNIIDLNLDLGKSNSQNLNNHTAYKFAEYLLEKYKYFTMSELDAFFQKIGRYELGDVYKICLSSLSKFMSVYQEKKQSNIKKQPTAVKYEKTGISLKELIGGNPAVAKEYALTYGGAIGLKFVFNGKGSGSRYAEYVRRHIDKYGLAKEFLI